MIPPLPRTLIALLAGFALAGPARAQDTQRIKDTVHNLSVSGPGTIRAAGESEVCIFCHTPHGSGDVRPLWNRSLSPGPYQIYQSSSLRATVGQPTGSSKLCLSCHDGTIALGSVLSRASPIPMSGGADRIPPGASNLGTDLSDDHPVSFAYSSSLSGGDSELLQPTAIVPPVNLDRNGELQCTSCHDAHDNSRGDFLLRSNEQGALCASCHRPLSWPTSAHATSSRTVNVEAATALGIESASMVDHACGSCHRTHSAGGPQWIIHLENISATCIPCHDGTVAGGNIEQDISKISTHGIELLGPSGTTGAPYLEGDRVSCADCHNSHAAGSTEGLGAGVPPSLARVEGIDLNGTPVPTISATYELCFRCHADAPARVDPVVSRQLVQTNTRLEFQPTNPSFHPVGNPGVNPDVPSLLPPYTTGSVIGCGDCHDSNTSRRLNGAGPAGPHGSVFPPLLAQRYETADFTIESSGAYALCYRCHQRDSILRDDSFPHREHVVEERTPCSACHDPHGISSAQGSPQDASHLINFDRAIVFPNLAGRLEFVDGGRFRGQCYLSCHGEDHNPESY